MMPNKTLTFPGEIKHRKVNCHKPSLHKELNYLYRYAMDPTGILLIKGQCPSVI